MIPTATLRLRESFDFDWQFRLGSFAHLAARSTSSRLEHRRTIPKGRTGRRIARLRAGRYRLVSKIASDLDERDRDRAIFIEFDGVYHNSDVWINGQHLGHRAYGYIGFEYELTPHLRFDGKANVIEVRVDNSDLPNCRWYSGSGIYRHVWLTKTSKLARVAHWSTYITTPKVSHDAAKVSIASDSGDP